MSENAIQKVVITSSRWNTQRILDGARSEGLAEFQLIQCEGTGESLRQIVDADVVIIGLWNPQLLNAARKLRWVHSGGGGVEGLLFPEFVESPVLLTCGKPYYGITGAEHALCAMLMFSRRLHFAMKPSPDYEWLDSQDDLLRPEDLSGKTVGIIGMGYMGQALTERARCLGMQVVGVARRPRAAPPVR